MLQLFFALTATITLVVGAPQPPVPQLVARQGDLNASISNDGGYLSAGLPLSCIEGCLEPMQAWGECGADGTDANCTVICNNQFMYNNLVACLECNIYNGAPVPMAELQDVLNTTNGYCSAANAIIGFYTTLTGSATTTEAVATSWEGPTATLPTWTGLVPFLTASEAVKVDGTSSPSPSQTMTTTASATATAAATNVSQQPSSAASRASSTVGAASTTTAAARSGAAGKAVIMPSGLSMVAGSLALLACSFLG